MRRWLRLAAVGLLATAAAACEPAAKPPKMGPIRRADAQLYERETATGDIGSAADGTERVVVWGRTHRGLMLDRFRGSDAPTGHTVLMDTGKFGWEDERYWSDVSVALGHGYAFASAEAFVSGTHGLDLPIRVNSLVSPTGRRITLTGGPRYEINYCDHPDSAYYAYASNAVAWTGSSFLVARGCLDRTDVFRVSTRGLVEHAARLPARGTTLAMASTGHGALLVYVSGHTRVRAQRLALNGRAVGPPLAVDLDPSAGQVAVAPSGNSYLIAWSVAGPTFTGNLLSTTVSSSGVLGVRRELATGAGMQANPTLVGASGGSWFAAWTDGPNRFEAADIHGASVTATGIVADAHPLASLPDVPETDPSLSRGPGGTTFLSWVRHEPDRDIGLTRQFNPDGSAVGASIQATRMPIEQQCRDVAAGNGGFLVTWHEERPGDGLEVYARRYAPDGHAVGPVISLPSAPGDQSCPTAAWNGSNWLIVWSDLRSTQGDIFGVLVSGSGVVSPSLEFPISTAAGTQGGPAVAANGTSWVVAWTDERNGNQDIYAARVAAEGSVLDPGGIALRTDPEDQRSVSVASTGGKTFVVWYDDDIEYRILRHDGTVDGPTRKLAEPWGRRYSIPPVTAAAPGRFGVVFQQAEYNPRLGYPVVLASVDAASGSVIGRTPVGEAGLESEFIGADVSHDGQRFVVWRGTAYSDFPGVYGGVVATVSAGQVRQGAGLQQRARIASLPSGRSLVVGEKFDEPTLVVAPVVDAP
jgi:hypothetical protein